MESFHKKLGIARYGNFKLNNMFQYKIVKQKPMQKNILGRN